MGRVRFLHISDLHEKAGRETEPWRRRRVLGETWLRNLAELAEEGPIDAGLFTGDAADRGQAAEFQCATGLLAATVEQLGLGLDRLFVIPGNHDVDRGIETDCWTELRKPLSSAAQLSAPRWMSG